MFDDGAVVVRAAPLRDVATATASLIRSLLVVGAGVLLLGGAATWWTVHRAVRPVDEMVETAEQIAAGDLTSRVPETATTTELSRLGSALNGILGMNRLARECAIDSRQSSYLDTVQESGKSLLGLINDLLDMAKLESGKEELFEERIDIAKVVASTLSSATARL